MNTKHSILFLSEQDLDRLNIRNGEVADRIENLVLDVRQGKAWVAPKSAFDTPDGRYMMATLSAADDPPFLAVKSVALSPRNAAKNLSQINALVTLLDSETGLPAAVVDGNWVTAVRTAAASLVAARRLARKDSQRIAFIGCGVQARSHLHAFAEEFPLRHVRAFGRGTTNRDAFCEHAVEMGFDAVASESAAAAIGDADIVISSVSHSASLIPFLDANLLPKGSFVSSTDARRPWRPDTLSAFDRIVIDDLAQNAAIPQEKMLPVEQISGDLGQLVSGEIPGRSSETERCAFLFRAVGLGDLALGALAVQRAREKKVGTELRN